MYRRFLLRRTSLLILSYTGKNSDQDTTSDLIFQVQVSLQYSVLFREVPNTYFKCRDFSIPQEIPADKSVHVAVNLTEIRISVGQDELIDYRQCKG